MINISEVTSDIFRQGHTAAWAGAWEKAAACYLQAFTSETGQARHAVFAAHALLEMGDPGRSLQYLEIASRLSPDDPVPVEKIGNIHEQQGNVPESIRCYEKSAGLYLKNNNNPRAVGCLQRILLLDPGHADARRELKSLSHGSDLSPADLTKLVEEPPAQTMSEAAAAAKKSPAPLEKAQETALTNLASLYFELAGSSKTAQSIPAAQSGQPAGAVRELSEDPDLMKLLGHLIRAAEYTTRGMDDWCLSELQALLQAGINNSAVHFLAGAILSGSRSSQALTHLKQTRSNPDYALASFLLIGQIYYAQENFAEAAAAYLQALAVADTSTPSEATVNKRAGMFKPLIQSYSRETNTAFLKNLCETIEQEINRPDWFGRLSVLHAQLSTGQQSGDTILAEVLAAGGSPLVQRFAEVKELEEENLADSAMEEIFYMIEDGPVLLPAQLLIAENLNKQGQTEEAVQKLWLAAKLYALRGQTDQSIQTLELAVQLSPTNVPIRTKLIEQMKRQSRMSQAVDHLRKLAEIHYQLAEPEKAHQLLEESAQQMLALKDGGKLSAALFHQDADLYLQDLQYQQACQVYEKILAIHPEDLFANVHVAFIYYRLGNRVVSRQKIINYVHFLEQNQKADQVEPFLKAMVTELPEDMETRKQLAEWYHKNGDKNRAIEQLDIIAVQLIKKGKGEAAIIVLRTIIALNPADTAKYKQLIAYLSAPK